MTASKQKANRWVASKQAEIAEFFGMSLDTVKGWAKQGMPGHPKAYDLSVIAKWLREKGPWRQHVRPESDDPLMGDSGDSPGLERYRLAKAELAEMDALERRGQLISTEKAKTILDRWAMVIRRMGEGLGRRYGAEAATEVNLALGECEHIVHEFDGGDSTN